MSDLDIGVREEAETLKLIVVALMERLDEKKVRLAFEDLCVYNDTYHLSVVRTDEKDVVVEIEEVMTKVPCEACGGLGEVEVEKKPVVVIEDDATCETCGGDDRMCDSTEDVKVPDRARWSDPGDCVICDGSGEVWGVRVVEGESAYVVTCGSCRGTGRTDDAID